MKKGKLYLANRYTYELLIENEENTVVINIARKPVFGINKHYKELAPSQELFDWFQKNKKKENWFKTYKKEYKKQIQNDKRALASMRQIKNDYLDKGIDVMLDAAKKIDGIFVEQAKEHNVDSNYKDFKFAVKNENGNILGGITGHRLFKDIHVSNLSIDKSCRGQGIGKNLLEIVEKELKNDITDYITLITNKFQKAVEFYKKCGFEIEFVRENQDDRFTKYYMIKKLR